MYQALYRKWRPGTFDDVVGQEHITTTLKNQIARGKPSHAYLFCGSRGTGKTSCSKILAKAVNCPNQQDGNPCCECDICKGIEADSILDITEIDAASNSGVDNIRDLREEAGFTPVVAKYRVYIIDETHMLSTGAFNALLKIMEEPPAHVLFILATTEIHKVPATILSRCQRFDFHRISSEIIARRLMYIAGQESVELDDDAAALIAKLSDGGMRDALSLLDLCVSAGGKITTQAVTDAAGLVDRGYLFRIAEALSAGDAGGALAVLEGLWEKSIDYQRLCEQLIGFYRNVMIIKSVRDASELVACLPDEMEWYQKLTAALSIQQILYSLTTLQNTLARMSRTAQRRTELELGLMRLANPALDTAPEALLARIESLERAVRSGKVARPAAEPALSGEKPPAEKARDAAPAPSESEIAKTPVEPLPQWQEVLAVLKTKNKALHGTLAESDAYVGGDLLLVDAGDSMFSRMVRGDSYAKESLRAAVEAVTGQKYRLGPYNNAKYKVQPKEDKLEGILQQAQDLGVDVTVKE